MSYLPDSKKNEYTEHEILFSHNKGNTIDISFIIYLTDI